MPRPERVGTVPTASLTEVSSDCQGTEGMKRRGEENIRKKRREKGRRKGRREGERKASSIP